LPDRLPLTLRAYRLVTAVAAPAADAFLAYRLKKGREHPERVAERRGISDVPRPQGPLVWLHGASVGELVSVLPLIERIRARDIAVLVTSGTVTSADVAERRLPSGVIHQFVPIDLPQYVARFLNHWQPDLGLFVESDLWPNLILGSAARNIPLILINGRVSERSFHRWQKAPRTISALLNRFDLCLAQSADDAARYATLVPPRYITTVNLKLDAPAPPAVASKLWELQVAVGTRPVIAAASTHPGEEIAMIDVHRRLKHSFKGLLTIIVPRHPERGDSIAGMARGQGLTFAQRSAGQKLERTTDVYIADTLGELGLIYRIAPIVFMGGSLVEHGGQNPIEAARLGPAILHGPHVWNFREVYAALDAAGGAELVTDTGKLAVRIGALLKDTAARGALAEAGSRAMEPLTGALERTIGALDPYILQFNLEGRGGQAIQERHA